MMFGEVKQEGEDAASGSKRCVEVVSADVWQKLVKSEHQVGMNDKKQLDRVFRSQEKAKRMSQEERENRWMKCFAQQMGCDDEDDVDTTASGKAPPPTMVTGVSKTTTAAGSKLT